MALKVLFLVFHGFSAHNGISKKIFGQVKGLAQNGADVRLCYYDVLEDGRRVWRVGTDIIADFGQGRWAKMKKRVDFSGLIRYVEKEQFDLIYMRSYHNASPFLVHAVRRFKQAGANVVMEIPTYPYDQEYISLMDKIRQWPDCLYRKKLAAQLDAIVTFTEEDEIFGKKTIRISNGIDFDEIPLQIRSGQKKNEIHLIGVAEIHYWHGFDRLIRGLGNYYKKNPGIKVFFHMVGNLSGEREKTDIYAAMQEGKVEAYVQLHGALWGNELDSQFNKADFAIGSLARHRSGITYIRTLKTREYAARGMSFMYSEMDADFENKPYVLKAPPDESAIDIESIVNYCLTDHWSAQQIRDDIKPLSWSSQMKIVTESLTIS